MFLRLYNLSCCNFVLNNINKKIKDVENIRKYEKVKYEKVKIVIQERNNSNKY